MKLLKRIRRLLFANPKTCDHKWMPESELYVKCDKCGELAVYVGERPLKPSNAPAHRPEAIK